MFCWPLFGLSLLCRIFYQYSYYFNNCMLIVSVTFYVCFVYLFCESQKYLISTCIFSFLLCKSFQCLVTICIFPFYPVNHLNGWSLFVFSVLFIAPFQCLVSSCMFSVLSFEPFQCLVSICIFSVLLFASFKCLFSSSCFSYPYYSVNHWYIFQFFHSLLLLASMFVF